jgi:hypothetical protein
MWSCRAANLVSVWLLFAGALFGLLVMPAAAQAEPPGRLFYEIVVTAPDTRSQGWHGVLYDSDGNPVQASPEQTVTTPLGDFVNVACIQPWDACGMIRVDMAEWMKTHPTNVPTVGASNDWTYRMYVSGEAPADQVWKSALLHDGTEIAPDATPIDTPMGPFRTAGPDAIGWARAGWFPVSWQEPAPQHP